MIFLTFAYLSVCGVKWEWLTKITYNRTAFYAFWGFANGPFAFAVIVFKNALVLHDLPNVASTFIHITPVSLSWTMRWYAVGIMKKYPGVFDLPNPEQAAAVSFSNVWCSAM